jgi:hypothetical protein
MLRLQRASKSSDIHVQLRTKERFFNPTLCLALGIAAFMHLAAIFFFHIKPFKIESQWIIPDVKVNSEIGLKVEDGDAFILAQIEEGKLLTPSFKAPPQPQADLPNFPGSYAIPPMALTERVDLEEVSRGGRASSMPHQTFPLKYTPLSTSFSCDSFDIAISGRLGDKEVVKKIASEQMTASVSSLRRVRSRHLVRVDESTGTIFWRKCLESTKNSELDQKAEKILAGLYFKPDPQAFDMEGEIEITFAIP